MSLSSAAIGILGGKSIWDMFSSMYTMSTMTPAQRQQMELQQKWQEDMRATQYQTQVEDMRKAGLNPALMYGSTPQSSTPSNGSVLPYENSNGSSINSLISAINDMRMKESSIALNEAQSDKIAAEAEGIRIDNEYRGREHKAGIDLTEATTKEKEAVVERTQAEVQKFISDIEVNGSTITKNQSEAARNIAQSVLFTVDAKSKELALPFVSRLQELSIELMEGDLKVKEQTLLNLKEECDKLESEAGISLIDYLEKSNLFDYTDGEKLIKDWRNGRIQGWVNTSGELVKNIGIGVGAAASGLQGGTVSVSTTTHNSYDKKGNYSGGYEQTTTSRR